MCREKEKRERLFNLLEILVVIAEALM